MSSASAQAADMASNLVELVRRLEEEIKTLKARIEELETSRQEPRVSGLIRARGVDVVNKTENVLGPNVRTVVRGKREREGMQGFRCEQCKEFYDALGLEPHRCSKHKLHRPPPDTPDGFWEPWELQN